MVEPIKGCTEVILHNPDMLPTLQRTTYFAVYGTQTKGFEVFSQTGFHTFQISKLGVWKHAAMFHKSAETNRHQTLKHIRQNWCYKNRSVISNKEEHGPFGILVTLACL